MRIKISFLLFIVSLIIACNRYDLFTHDNNKILINEVKTSFLDKKANNNTNNQILN